MMLESNNPMYPVGCKIWVSAVYGGWGMSMQEYDLGFKAGRESLVGELIAMRQRAEAAEKAAKAKSQWISVKDRLPDFDGSVIVCHGKWVDMAFCDDGKLTTIDGRSMDIDVDYWQPMPPPPKVEK